MTIDEVRMKLRERLLLGEPLVVMSREEVELVLGEMDFMRSVAGQLTQGESFIDLRRRMGMQEVGDDH